MNWYHSECNEKTLGWKSLWKRSIEIFTSTFWNYWTIVDQWHWLGEADHQNFDTSFVSQIKTPPIVFINFDTGSERRQTHCRKPILSLRRKNFDFRQSDYFKRIGNFRRKCLLPVDFNTSFISQIGTPGFKCLLLSFGRSVLSVREITLSSFHCTLQWCNNNNKFYSFFPHYSYFCKSQNL